MDELFRDDTRWSDILTRWWSHARTGHWGIIPVHDVAVRTIRLPVSPDDLHPVGDRTTLHVHVLG